MRRNGAENGGISEEAVREELFRRGTMFVVQDGPVVTSVLLDMASEEELAKGGWPYMIRLIHERCEGRDGLLYTEGGRSEVSGQDPGGAILGLSHSLRQIVNERLENLIGSSVPQSNAR